MTDSPPRGWAMGLVLAIVVVVVGLVAGIHGIRALREMMRQGRSYVLHDWRSLFGKRPEYDRNDQPALFWITIFANSFFTTIALCFPLGIVLMFAIPAAAIIFGWGQ
jgi:hypothetical protein